MKPRVFLGSSVEGLSVAYAIQTNLVHDAEITVWSQGVFELSNTTIESLFDILDTVDFGVFVFTPDDLIKIRNNSNATVRDNVLFEFGLFLGKLGRKRVFFIIPSDHELHLPTDLLGVTPAKYESNREDGNLAAATGPASHSIRLMIKKHGLLQQVEETSTTPEIIESVVTDTADWYQYFIDKKYVEAIEKLDDAIKKEEQIDLLIGLKALKAVCHYRIDEKNSNKFDEILIEYENEHIVYITLAPILLWENLMEKSINLIEKGILKFGNSSEFIKILAKNHLKNGDKELAISCFDNDLTYSDPEAAIKFAEIHIEDSNYTEARSVIHKAYLNFPNNKLLLAKYALIAESLDIHRISLYCRDQLLKQESDSPSNNGLLGNSCLNLDLNDYALSYYQKANELSSNSKSWILSNIGNLLKNRGFYSEGIKYFRQALEMDDSSLYATERLATSLKLKDDEQKSYNNLIKEGRKLIKEYSDNLISLNITEE